MNTPLFSGVSLGNPSAFGAVSAPSQFLTGQAPDDSWSLPAEPWTTPAAQPGAPADRHGTWSPLEMNSAVRPVESSLPWWKHVIDLAACVVGLPVLGLCTLAMSVLTLCVSPGPVFFRQERIGHRGRRFKIYKFRTMRVDADSAVHQNYCADLISTNAPMVKLDSRGDKRLIPGAWILRACGFDELPQLINVFLGDMSLVGPRPCLPAEFKLYTDAQRQRCDVLPGLTGLWQVSGKNRTTFEEMINLDVRYARTLSLWLDLKIILLTAPCLLVQYWDTRRMRNAQPAPAPRPVEIVRLGASTESRAP